MSSDDISPSSLPLQTRLREYRDGLRDFSMVTPSVIHTVHEYVDIAKRILLEHRVRDFTAADVVALAAIMEQRDRLTRQPKGE
jgi:hypothetical protein